MKLTKFITIAALTTALTTGAMAESPEQSGDLSNQDHVTNARMAVTSSADVANALKMTFNAAISAAGKAGTQLKGLIDKHCGGNIPASDSALRACLSSLLHDSDFQKNYGKYFKLAVDKLCTGQWWNGNTCSKHPVRTACGLLGCNLDDDSKVKNCLGNNKDDCAKYKLK